MAKDVKSAQLCFIENVLTAEEGFTALRLVCQFGHSNNVALLLKSGVGSHKLTKLCGGTFALPAPYRVVRELY